MVLGGAEALYRPSPRSPSCHRASRWCPPPAERCPFPRGRRSVSRNNSAKPRPVRSATMSESKRKFWLTYGIPRPRNEMQRPGRADHPRRFGIAERRLNRRAVQHRDSPVVAQPRLVVAQMKSGRRGLSQQRQPRAHIVVQHGRIRESIQHHTAGELLGDGAHPEQSARREGDAALGVGPTPGVADQNLAVAQHGDRAAWPGVGPRQRLHDAIKEGTRHIRFYPRPSSRSNGSMRVIEASSQTAAMISSIEPGNAPCRARSRTFASIS